jgi:hypothetical protein
LIAIDARRSTRRDHADRRVDEIFVGVEVVVFPIANHAPGKSQQHSKVLRHRGPPSASAVPRVVASGEPAFARNVAFLRNDAGETAHKTMQHPWGTVPALRS